MSTFSFKPATPGEVLLYLVQAVLVAQEGEPDTSAEHRSPGARQNIISSFSEGMLVLNLVARLTKKAHKVMEIDDASLHQPIILKYLQVSLGLAEHGDGLLDDLARQSLEAARVSGRPISPSIKRLVLGGNKEAGCYLCGAMCNEESVDVKARVSYEHIWPSSYGGSSILENLLPACHWCNNAKSDMLLWHTGALFAFVLKPEPSEEERKSISRREKIARRMQDILDFANATRCTLKEAAVALGPVQLFDWSVIDVDDAVDFFNIQFA